MDNATFTQSFLSGCIELVFTATDLGKDSGLVFIPCVASVQTPGGVFAAEVENHTFLCGREVMLTAVPPFLIAEHRPIHVNGVVDAQIDGSEIASIFMRIRVNEGVGIKNRTPNRLDRLFIATHASSQHLADDDERDDGGTPRSLHIPCVRARVFLPFASMGLSYVAVCTG